jgi:hypothetical protein
MLDRSEAAVHRTIAAPAPAVVLDVEDELTAAGGTTVGSRVLDPGRKEPPMEMTSQPRSAVQKAAGPSGDAESGEAGA